MELKYPTRSLVQEYKRKFDDIKNKDFRHYAYQEKAVKKIAKNFPKNTNLQDIMLKVGIINSFYSTNIFKPYAVADHIHKLNNVDKKLKRGDKKLVDSIAKVNISGTNRTFYSFATKYCSIHKPEFYPIYDSYIDWLLIQYKKKYKFAKFTREEIKDYHKFVEVLNRFKSFFRLENYNYKEIDKFLWRYAKDIKPKKN